MENGDIKDEFLSLGYICQEYYSILYIPSNVQNDLRFVVIYLVYENTLIDAKLLAKTLPTHYWFDQQNKSVQRRYNTLLNGVNGINAHYMTVISWYDEVTWISCLSL